MRTVLNGPLPPEVDDLLARIQSRLIVILDPLYRQAGLTPIAEFNLGDSNDYRVPDGGALRQPSDAVFGTDAAIVVEVLTPDDESWQKFDHYERSGVEEIFIVDPDGPSVQIFVRGDAGFGEHDRSELLDVSAAHLEAELSLDF